MSQSPKVYVLDTSVLLSEGSKALFHYGQDEVVIPLAVIEELESKRNEPAIGRFARDVLRTIEELNVKSNGAINTGVTSNAPDGIIRTEINHVDNKWLPEVYKRDTRNDTRIITVAGNLCKEGRDVTIVSKDISLRLKANVIMAELKAEPYHKDDSVSGSWTGIEEILIEDEAINLLHQNKVLSLPDARKESSPANTGVILSPYGNPKHTTLGVMDSKGVIRKTSQNKEVFGVKGRSVGQKIAINYLVDPNMSIVSLGGKAGTGKTMLAVAAGLEQTLETNIYKKITVFRPIYAVGGQELGYLPGDASTKMDPWGDAIFDSIESTGTNVIDGIKERGILEILPVTNIRGRTFNDTFILVDEAQNYDTPTLLTILSRVGVNSKIVFSWDGAQRDNPMLEQHDGIVNLIDLLSKEEVFAHVSLMKSERSQVAEIASNILERYLS